MKSSGCRSRYCLSKTHEPRSTPTVSREFKHRIPCIFQDLALELADASSRFRHGKIPSLIQLSALDVATRSFKAS